MTRLTSVPGLSLETVSLWPESATGKPIISGVDLQMPRGGSMALVGESGAGKTSLALAIMGMWPGRVSGNISLDDSCLTKISESEYREMRGTKLVLLFQDPMTALNPSLAIGWQLREILRVRRGLPRAIARIKAFEWLERVGLKPGRELSRLYVHQLSGGMAQRAALAMALACEPELLIADEPFSALDPITAKDQIDLLIEERKRLGFSMLLITHDLSLAAQLTESTSVLKNGKLVESSSTYELLSNPKNAYTKALVKASGVGYAPIGESV